MIQRIQTVYFFIAILLVSIPLASMTFFSYTINAIEFHVTAFGIENMTKPEVDGKTYFLPMLAIALLLFSAIFSFKNRKRQITLSWLAMVLNISSAAWMATMSFTDAKACTECETSGATPALGFYLYIAAFIFILLGNLGVRKDKKLVDSLDRLR